MSNIIKVAVLGASGKMGLELVRAVSQAEGFLLTDAIDLANEGQDVGLLAGIGANGIKIKPLDQLGNPDLLIDFTNAAAFRASMETILKKNINVVSGSTGLSNEELAHYGKLARENNVTLFLAPNFAIGAVLMMKFAKEAAAYMADIEVIEYHHDQKLDAPSGTAKKTLDDMALVRGEKAQGHPQEFETIEGARGGNYKGMRVHSIRLPGYVASQEVIFGSQGQTLTVRHDSISRESFMPGVLLACRKIKELEKGLVYGLEEIL